MDYLSRILIHLAKPIKLKGSTLKILISLTFSLQMKFFCLLRTMMNTSEISNLLFTSLKLPLDWTSTYLSLLSLPLMWTRKGKIELPNVGVLTYIFFLIPYLDMPLGGKPRTCYFWKNITNKIHKNSAIGNMLSFKKVVGLYWSTPLWLASPHINYMFSDPPRLLIEKLKSIRETFIPKGNFGNLYIKDKPKLGKVVCYYYSMNERRTWITLIGSTKFCPSN